MSPLGNRLLVKIYVKENIKGSLLLLKSDEKVKTGYVKASGPGRLSKEGYVMPMEVAINDKVIFPMYAGTPVTVDDTNDEYLIISEDEILAVLED